MPSELQRVARGLVDCLDEVPGVVAHLQRTADRCRENAQIALMASHGQAKVAAQQLDAAARACEAAAHYLQLAPPKARGWAERLVGAGGPSTNRPSSDSADRNKATGGSADVDSKGRTERLTATFEDLEVADDNEPVLITVARKAFEKYRRAREKDEEDRELPEDPLEVEITITESGDIEFDERDEKEEKKRNDHLLDNFEIEVDLQDQIRTLLATMSESADQEWHHATLSITTDRIDATFDYPEELPEPVVVDLDLPDLPTLEDLDFDTAMAFRPLGPLFAPGVHDPTGRFTEKEQRAANYLEGRGWRVDARPEDHGSGQTNPDMMVRKGPEDEGSIVELKTQDGGASNAVTRNMLGASGQTLKAGVEALRNREVVIDGRKAGVTEETAFRSFRRACGQPGKTVVDVVHVILGDGRFVTFTKEH